MDRMYKANIASNNKTNPNMSPDKKVAHFSPSALRHKTHSAQITRLGLGKKVAGT